MLLLVTLGQRLAVCKGSWQAPITIRRSCGVWNKTRSGHFGLPHSPTTGPSCRYFSVGLQPVAPAPNSRSILVQRQQAKADDAESTTTTTETHRLPVGELFEGRNYIFQTTRNIRSYESERKETEELWDDLIDQVFPSKNKEPQDYELQQIVLVSTDDWDKKLLGIGNRYDVHDGQQRIVTLALVFAALRDSLRSAPNQEETVKELTLKLNPSKARKGPVLRIEPRKREATMLPRILTPELTESGDRVDLVGLIGEVAMADRKNKLSQVDQRLIANYELLLQSANALSVDDKLKIIDYLQDRVYFLVCITASSRIARNIVMGQGKGKNNEPIDDFKGLVCFREIAKEEDQDDIFQQWDELYRNAGRDTVADACLLLASAEQRERVKKNDEINVLEAWMKVRLLASGEHDGKYFFLNAVAPAAKLLKDFREKRFEMVAETAPGAHELRGRIEMQMRLRFICSVSQISTCKEIELALLHQLMVLRRQQLSAEVFELQIKDLERLALWMLFLKPSPTKRHRRCCDLLEIIFGGLEATPDILAKEERQEIRHILDTFEFGSKTNGKKIATALLERLNARLLFDNHQASMPECSRLQLEHILPIKADGEYWANVWPESDTRSCWTHRIGNLALLNQSANAKASNNSFSAKKDFYKDSPYPLTKRRAEEQDWDIETVQKCHQELLHLVAYKEWGL